VALLEVIPEDAFLKLGRGRVEHTGPLACSINRVHYSIKLENTDINKLKAKHSVVLKFKI
jgi:hypothetical protein